MPKARLVKWGNSLAVRIPKTVADRARIKEGDPIFIEALDEHVRPRLADKAPTLGELVARITPENLHPEVDWGPEVGQERVEWRPATAPRVRRSGSRE